jgi:DNA-directed RNA polymerase subunit RPC12/RpoP
MSENMTDMNMWESREFVVKYRPICCGNQVGAVGHELTNNYQHFVCRGCDKRIKIQYWPLSYERMRDLKLNSILQ